MGSKLTIKKPEIPDGGEFSLKAANDNQLAAQIREKIGAGPDELVKVVTPQFKRSPGDPEPAFAQRYLSWWEDVKSLDYAGLKEMGCRPWNDPKNPDPEDVEAFGKGNVLMLFPGEWYPCIPPGMGIVDIFGAEELFVPGQTDDDIRIGCLAFGFVVEGSK